MALHRLFKICGPGLGFPNKDQQTCHDKVNVNLWMKHRARASNRSARIRLAARKLGSSGHGTITHYFTRDMCRLCGGGVHIRKVNVKKSERGMGLICPQCASTPQRAVGLLKDRAQALTRNLRRLDMACELCSGCSRTPSMLGRTVTCTNLSCHLLYMRRVALEQHMEAQNEVNDAMVQLALEW